MIKLSFTQSGWEGLEDLKQAELVHEFQNFIEDSAPRVRFRVVECRRMKRPDPHDVHNYFVTMTASKTAAKAITESWSEGQRYYLEGKPLST